MNMSKLTTSKKIEIRFHEVDSMGIVWHGSYMQYFEDAREEFGKKYDLGYMLMARNGYYAPLVDIQFSYKKPIQYEEAIEIGIEYVPTEAAKICFLYTIKSLKTGEVLTTGSSIQVFLDKNYQLVLCNPEFYAKWKTVHLTQTK